MSDEVRLEWRAEGRIMVLSLASVTRVAVDAFIEQVVTQLNAWPDERPLLILYDVRESGFTPYLRQRSQWAAQNTPDRKGRAAFLLTRSPLHQILQFSLKRHLNEKQHLQRAIFFDEAAAMAWLEVLLSESPT